MRHGMPKVDRNARVSAEEFGIWVRGYDAAGIDEGHRPPPTATAHADRCAFIVCSNLPRSLESAKTLGIQRVHVSDPEFREMEMPHAAWRFPRLSLMAWATFFRIVWMFGYSANAESFKAARGRARSCAERLIELAGDHGTVLFVGHGSLNWFIAKRLKAMGWSCATRPPRHYWEASVYQMSQ